MARQAPDAMRSRACIPADMLSGGPGLQSLADTRGPGLPAPLPMASGLRAGSAKQEPGRPGDAVATGPTVKAATHRARQRATGPPDMPPPAMPPPTWH